MSKHDAGFHFQRLSVAQVPPEPPLGQRIRNGFCSGVNGRQRRAELLQELGGVGQHRRYTHREAAEWPVTSGGGGRQ